MALGAESSDPNNFEEESAGDARALLELSSGRPAQKKDLFPGTSVGKQSSAGNYGNGQRVPPKELELNRVKTLSKPQPILGLQNTTPSSTDSTTKETLTSAGPKEPESKPGLDDVRNVDKLLH
jgi:hypothetical protein